MAPRLHHLALKVRDVARVAVFYRDVLGLPVDRRHEDAAGLRAVWLRLDPGLLMVERHDGPDAPRDPDHPDGPGWHLLAIALPPREWPAARARLEAHGVAIEHTSDYTMYLRDPEGHRVALSAFPERAPGADA